MVGKSEISNGSSPSKASISIPFNRPSIEGRELQYVADAINGGHLSSDGPFAALAAKILRDATHAADVLLTTSCTDALEMSALLLDLQPGDTVIVPSFTFVSTALAFVRAGARIIFADIEPSTLGINPSHVAELMDESVRAVVAVHYAGVGCDISGLKAVLSDWPDVDLIEDNAHGLFGTYQGSPLGSFGRFSTLSFHETKNISCGEGGALVVNDQADIERAHVLFDKGTNRRSFMLGQVDKYSWVDTGSSFGLSDLLAAYLLGQLEQWEKIVAMRRAIFDRYLELLAPLQHDLEYRLPVVPSDRRSAHHMFYALLQHQQKRDQVLRGLRAKGIHATFHYIPLHSSPAGKRYQARRSECPVTDNISGRLLRLPLFNDLSLQDVERTAEIFLKEVQQ